MALTLDRPRAAALPPGHSARASGRWVVPISVVVTVALRLPFLAHAASPDEAGFLLVGGQWHGGGTALYGNYWVDRPPLLIQIFQVATSLGGVVALRLIGCLAVAIVVALCAKSAALVAGPRAARWAAVTAAALCTTPLLGTRMVNGELLAAPFIAAGITATIASLASSSRRRAHVLAMAGGASGMCALLVKQNFADVFVFAAVLAVVAWRRRGNSGGDCLRVLGATAIGALLAAYAVGLVSALHGTSLHGVYDAMFPFRIAAGRVQAAGGSHYAAGRLDSLLLVSLASGIALLLIAAASAFAARRNRSTTAIALMTMSIFDVVAIGFGGNYWHHYLIALIVPVATLTGVLGARRRLPMRPLVALVATAAVVSWGAAAASANTPIGTRVGNAIAAAAQPHDTIVTAYGHADVDHAAGLPSPYEYLWSLPVRTLDPQLSALSRVLDGPDAPTWFVTWNHISSWGLDSHNVATTIAGDYRPFAQVCGHTIYLRNGLVRPQPTTKDTCS